MIGTRDQSCWLAEACKILLLLLLSQQSATKMSQVFHKAAMHRAKHHVPTCATAVTNGRKHSVHAVIALSLNVVAVQACGITARLMVWFKGWNSQASLKSMSLIL